jgi:hypothetical protein
MTPLVLDSDTCIWWSRHHPTDIYTQMWSHLDRSVSNGEIRVPQAVYDDLCDGVDLWEAWIDARPSMIIPFDPAFESHLREVVRRFPTLATPGSSKNRSDPHVVAGVLTVNGIGVTRESPRRPASARVKIPDAIRGFEKTSLDWFGFLRHARSEFGWVL